MEITAILAVISPIAVLLFGLIAMRRGQKTDDASSGREMGTLLSDIGYVKSSVDSIAKKLEGYDERFTAMVERVTKVEQSSVSAHKRLDGHNEEIDGLRKRAHDLANRLHTCRGCEDK